MGTQSRGPVALGAERRRLILNLLRAEGKVLAAELSAEFGVSPDTVRRDLDELARAGLLQRVHGGALPPPVAPRDYASRRGREVAAKAGIARTAAGLARSGDVIVLDGGTTAVEVARHLPRDLTAAVITTSPPVALALADHPGVEVTLAGGTLDKSALVTVGAAAVEALRTVRADLCYLGVCGLHPEVGITTTDLEERHAKRAMIEASARVVALADAGKLDTGGPLCRRPDVRADPPGHRALGARGDPGALPRARRRAGAVVSRARARWRRPASP